MALAAITCFWLAMNIGAKLVAEDPFEQPPIRYSTTQARDPVALLQQRLDRGESNLERDPKFGYLPSLLRALDVPVASQVLAFSKTSLQIHRISPANPRAIYFSDSIYIGYVPGSPVLELAANDPDLGAVFYTLEDLNGLRFQLTRDRGQCLSCHATHRTEQVPGYLIRSIFPDRAGRPRTGSSSYTSDDRSPWEQRWGGWYVTGKHGTMRHMGNAFAVDRMDPQLMDRESGANQWELPERVVPDRHLQPTSDLVALLVLEHQTHVHNLITRASYEARQALALDASMNEALGRPVGFRSESTQRRIDTAVEELVRALLMADAQRLTAQVEGRGGFQAAFEQRGPSTRDGRSLRALDLQSQLFRYPLSFLIYTPEFQQLPSAVMDPIRQRLQMELSERGPELGAGLVAPSQRRDIREIVAETLPSWLVFEGPE